MAIDWNAIGVTLTSTAVVVAGMTYLAKKIFEHFLKHDLEAHKVHLKEQADARLRALEHENARNMAVYKEQLDEQLKRFDAELAKSAQKEERVRLEIDRWSNPILGAVRGLHKRLENILARKAFVALRPGSPQNPDWKLEYEHFFPATVFLFAQFFCWVRLLEERLTFDLFEGTAERDDLLARIRAVQQALSDYPLKGSDGLPEGTDAQVFLLQQRQAGEALIVGSEESPRCMRYADFMAKWNDREESQRAAFRSAFGPLVSLLDRLDPEQKRRWYRLDVTWKRLVALDEACTKRLNPTVTA
jgi:hypothetical protein